MVKGSVTPSPEPSPAPLAAPPLAPPPARRRWRRRVLIFVLALVVLGLLGRVLLPPAAQWALGWWGESALGVPVTVTNVDFALTRGGVRIEQLQIGSDDARWEQFDVELSWRDLLSKRLHLRRAACVGARIRLQQRPDGTVELKSASLGGQGGVGDGTDGEAGQPATVAEAGWTITLDRLEFVDTAVTLLDAEGRTALDLVVPLLELEGLDIDLDADRGVGLDLEEVHIDGLRLTVRDDLRPPPAGAETPAGPPPRVRVGRVLVEQAEITVEGSEAVLRLTPHIDLRDVSFEAGAPLGVTVRLGIDAALLSVEGDASLDPLSFTGDLVIEGASVPAYVAARWPEPTAWWRDGSLSSALQVQHGPEGTQAAGGLTVEGLALADPRDPRRALAWQRLHVQARTLRMPTDGPVQVDLESLSLEGPVASWVLAADGAQASEANNEADEPELADAPDGAPASASGTTESVEAPGPAAGVLGIDFALEALSVTGGTVSLWPGPVGAEALAGDQAPGADQPLAIVVQEWDVAARQLRFPDVRALEARVSALLAPESAFVLEASLDGDAGDAQAFIERLPLPRFSALAEQAAGYKLHAGSLSLDSAMTVREQRYEAGSTVVLHDLEISSTEPGAFRRVFGMPLDLALALLRDAGGDIELSLPLVVDQGRAEVGLPALIASTLREALVGALTSPLKLMGAVFDGGEGGQAQGVEVEPLACVPGQALLEPDEFERLTSLIALLEQRPALALRLRGSLGPADREGLARQALIDRVAAGEDLPDLDGSGWFAPGRVAAALASHGHAAADALDADDQGLLLRYVEAEPIGAEELDALARRRAEALRAFLLAEHDLPPEAVVSGEPSEQAQAAVHVDVTVRSR